MMNTTKNRLSPAILQKYRFIIVVVAIGIIQQLSYTSSFSTKLPVTHYNKRVTNIRLHFEGDKSLSLSDGITVIPPTSDTDALYQQSPQEGNDNDHSKTTHLVFPGGGIFFYWQAGVVTYLREQNYNLDTHTKDNSDEKIIFTGASAGALCATLTCTNVDFISATELALHKSEEAGIWDRTLGLYGIWGDLIEEWLYELLPNESIDLVDDRLNLLVTSIPSFRKQKISSFHDKDDLIRCNMASVHIPLFLDGQLTTNFRSTPHIDGSFLLKPNDYHNNNDNTIIFDWGQDPLLCNRSLGDAVSAISKEGIWDLLEQGRKYAKIMEKRGDFDSLRRM